MKRYPLYKDSGVDWIGDIPNHWTISRLKNAIAYALNGIWGDEPREDGTDILCIRVADFEMKRLGVSQDNLTYRYIPIQNNNHRLLSKGDLLIEKSGGGEKQPVGRVISYELNDTAVSSNFIAKISPNRDIIHSRFLLYSFNVCYSLGINNLSIKQTTGIQNLDTTHYFNNQFCFPSISEQSQIVTFLDLKIQEIDDLIKKKQNLIELLKEELISLINHSVTKGLDHPVPMKDSEIEWLGNVPEHWEVKKIKYLSSLKSGESITSELIKSNSNYPVFGGNGIRGYYTSYTHDGNYVLIGRQGALCGNINYAFGKFWASEHAVVASLGEETNIIWFGELLKSMNLNSYSQSAAQPGLAVEMIKNLRIPVPPIEEQNAIGTFIQENKKRIESITNLNAKEVAFLDEFKTSLINNAITGKIDVRDNKISHA